MRIHHLGLTVTDATASARWYEDVLGFRPAGAYTSEDGSRRKVFLSHEGLGVRIGLCQHTKVSTPTGDRFDETRPGLDHLSFEVESLDELRAWEQRLHDATVVCSPIAQANTLAGTSVLVFRDPDNIQLELIASG
jgi:glyoxylase I family protein